MIDNIKISVIIPSYKPQSYVFDCLNSIFNQTLNINQFEVIIVLNGCCHPYLDELNYYIDNNAPKDLFIKLIQTDILGVSNARNIGLDNAQGEFVSFIDDDDLVSLDYLQDLLLHVDDESISVSNLAQLSTSSICLNKDYISNAFEELKYSAYSLYSFRSFLSSSCCKLIPISIIKSNRFNSNIKIGEDSLFMASISHRIKKINLSDSAIYYRRLRNESASKVRRSFCSKFLNSLCISFYMAKILLPKAFTYLPLNFVLNRILAPYYILFKK